MLYSLVYLHSFFYAYPQSHLLSFGAASISLPSVSPDHSGGGPSPTVTHPHLLHLAGSLMQNEALTLYQSVKALFAITPISWTHSLINVHFSLMITARRKTPFFCPLPTINNDFLCSADMVSNMLNFPCECIQGSD